MSFHFHTYTCARLAHFIYHVQYIWRVATPSDPYSNVWPEGGVVLHVKECLQTCCFVVFIVVSFHTHIQSFSFITCPISQLCAQICPYYNVWPGAVLQYIQHFQYDVARRVSEPHMSAKFHGLVLFGL